MKKMLGMFFCMHLFFLSLMLTAQDFTVSNVSITSNLNPAAIGQNSSIDLDFSFLATPTMPDGVDENDCQVDYLFEWRVDGTVVETNYAFYGITLSSDVGELLRSIMPHQVDVYVIGCFNWIDYWGIEQNQQR